MGTEPILAADLPAETRELAALLLARLGMARRRVRVELETDRAGELLGIWLHEHVPAADLVRFDPPV